MAAQWANHARAMATRINPIRPSIRPHSLSFSHTHLFCGLLSRCLRAAAAVKTRLLAHIEKKPRRIRRSSCHRWWSDQAIGTDGDYAQLGGAGSEQARRALGAGRNLRAA
jgi:hypothetical protein